MIPGRLAGWSTLANNGCSPNHVAKERTKAGVPSFDDLAHARHVQTEVPDTHVSHRLRIGLTILHQAAGRGYWTATPGLGTGPKIRPLERCEARQPLKYQAPASAGQHWLR